MSIVYAKEIIFSFSSLAVFDDRGNILVRFSYKVFINKTPSIFARIRLKFTSLSIFSNVYLDKIV